MDLNVYVYTCIVYSFQIFINPSRTTCGWPLIALMYISLLSWRYCFIAYFLGALMSTVWPVDRASPALFLQILDHEQEVTSATGKGHTVIPAFTFYRDRTADEDDKKGKRGLACQPFCFPK